MCPQPGAKINLNLTFDSVRCATPRHQTANKNLSKRPGSVALRNTEANITEADTEIQ